MKKLILTLSLILISFTGFSQATNVDEFRIANATTAFGQNLPVGTKVYNIATGDYWVANAGVASTATLTTAAASFDQINGAGTDDQNITGGSWNSGTGELTIGIEGGTSQTIDIDGRYLETEVDGSVTNELQTVANTSNATTHTVTLSDSGGSLQLAEGANVTLTTSGTGADGIVTIAATGDGTGTDDQNLSLGTVTGTTMDVDIETGTNVTLTAATTSNAGLLTGADKTKLDGIASGAEVNLTMITEAFEEDDGTATAHSLSQTAVTAQNCTVSLNGAVLDPADYTFTSTTITISVPVLQYDKVVITYSY